MASPDIENIIRSIGTNNTTTNFKPVSLKATNKAYQGATYDVPKAAIYDKLSTGELVPRFENYKGATGNENRLALEQSATEKVWNGLVKNSAKALNYALDNVIGTGYGLVSAVTSGRFEDIYDNDFGNAMDDINKKWDYALPNYYSDEEKSMNFLQKMGTANFWANDVGNGLAFVGGALIPSAIMSVATGGAGLPSLGTGLAKTSAKLGLKTAGKVGTGLIDDVVRGTVAATDDIAEATASATRIGKYTAEAERGASWLKTMSRSSYAKKGGDILSTAGFLARTSSFEAGMEARQAMKSSMDRFISTFEERNGRPATLKDIQDFTKDATKAANSLYGANMAILAVSNSIMFGKTLGAIGPNTSKLFNNAGNRLIGLGTKAGEEAGTIAVRTATRGQKILGNTYKILGKPISEGIYEEGFQGVASKTMESYLNHKYDPKHIGGYDMWSEVTDAFAKQYGTNEGWTEMGIGMLIGGFGGVFQKQGVAGFGKNSWKSARTELENQVEEANKGVDKIKGLNRASSAQAFGQMAANKEATNNNFDISNPSIANTVANTEFIKSQMSVKSPKEIKADFEAIVDNMQLSESDLQAIGGESNIDAYKQGLKDDFNQTAQDLMQANKIVDALGLNRKLKDTPGNLSQIGEAVAMSFVLGKQGLYNAQEIGKQIDSMVGTNGIFNSLQHYNNLNESEKQKLQELQDKQDEYKALNDTAVQIGQQLAEQNQAKGETEGIVENPEYKSLSEKMVLTQKRMNQLNIEIETIKQAVGKTFNGSNFNLLDAQQQTATTGDIFQSLEELSKLDAFRESLAISGNTEAVNTLNTLVSRYKEFSNAHREMNNTIRNMMDTNFFSSKEGKGLLDKIKGKNYQMDDSFKQLIKENNQYLVDNFYQAGIDNEDVEAVLKANLEDNENLSDREKYRLESIVRLMLSQQQAQQTLDTLASPIIVEEADTATPENTLEGDTIELAEQIDFKESGLTPIDQLKEAIAKITKQLDGIVNSNRDNQPEIDRLQKELETLKQQRDAIKESSKQEEISSQQSGSSEYQGVGIGQQTSGETQGIEGKSTTNEADSSDSNISSNEGQKEEVISDEVYKDFVDNGNVSGEVLQSLADKIQNNEQLSERELAIFMDKVSEINRMLVEANKQTTTEEVDTVSENINEIDSLIDQRVRNYGLTPVDIFDNISEADSNIIDRAKAGEVVDINALQGVIDYLYSKYKEVVALKNNDAARVEKGLKTQYLLDVQAMLEEDLDYLVGYVNKIKAGESIQQGANQTRTEANVSSTATQTTNETVATPITGTTTNIRVNPKDVATDILNIEEQIAQIEAKINELASPFKIIDTKEYTRYSELLKKKDSGTQLEESEVKELGQLRSDIDQWLLITGTVVDGLRLSDLIRQQSVIANTEVATVEDLVEMTTKEVMEQISFDDVARGNYNSSIAQSYDAAMVSVDNRGNIVISGVTEEGLRELTPVDFKTENEKYPEDVQERGNTILSQETVTEINSNPDSKITIRPTNKDTSSSYSYVVEFKNMAGNETAIPLKTDFSDLNGSMETDTIYDVEPGDAVSLRVDPQDGYNKELTTKYKKAKTKKEKAKILNEMAKTLVVRIYHNGLFKGVLKAKNSRAKALDKTDDKFEVMRDMIVNRPDFIDSMDSGVEFNLDEFEVTAEQVLPGHPFLNMTKDTEGSVTIDYKEITTQDAKSISDIGFVEGGKITTRNKVTGIDTTFLKPVIKRNGKSRTPFIVIKKGNKLIAYPAKVKTTKTADTTRFEDIFKKENTSNTQKIINLNKFLAENGVNIKEQGKAFLPTNLTQEFFDKMKTELEGKQYFYSLDEWMNPNVSQNEILTQQILVNLNISQGFHSPKIKLDFSKVYEGITLPEVTAEDVKESTQDLGKRSNAAQKLAALRGKQETNTNC